MLLLFLVSFFFFQAEDGIRDDLVTGVQTCALPISVRDRRPVGGRHRTPGRPEHPRRSGLRAVQSQRRTTGRPGRRYRATGRVVGDAQRLWRGPHGPNPPLPTAPPQVARGISAGVPVAAPWAL